MCIPVDPDVSLYHCKVAAPPSEDSHGEEDASRWDCDSVWTTLMTACRPLEVTSDIAVDVSESDRTSYASDSCAVISSELDVGGDWMTDAVGHVCVHVGVGIWVECSC